MFANPLREISAPKTNVRVDYVYEHGSHVSDKRIPVLRRHCNEKGVRFVAREYAPRKYSEDREFIESLPAMHAHAGRAYKKTFYPSENIDQIIDDIIDESKRRLTIQEAWSRRINSVASALRVMRLTRAHALHSR